MLDIGFYGATLGLLHPIEHRMLIMDYEDEDGIMQHPIFEGDREIEIAIEELNDMRSRGKEAIGRSFRRQHCLA